MPPENKKYEKVVRAAFAEQLPGFTPIPEHTPIRMEVTFWFPRPKSHYGTGRNAERLKDSAPQYHVTKPDMDNTVKLLKDGLAGLAWHDDRQVCEYGEIKKRYVTPEHPEPCTEMTFWEIRDEAVL
jgi:Holliday junction resolvase RusA-like endonuclease